MKKDSNDIVIPVHNIPQTFEKDIHGDFNPFNAWYGKLFQATISWINQSKKEKKARCRVWRISPVGVEICSDSEVLKLDMGQTVKLDINLAGNWLKFNGIIKKTEYIENGYNLVGICMEKIKDNTDKSDKNKSWSFSKEFSPTGWAPCPVKNSHIFFSVRQINKKGMLISVSSHNKYMIPGIVLKCHINLVMFGEVNTFLKIEKVSIKEENDEKLLLIYGVFIKPCKNFHSKFSEYILKYGSIKSCVKELNKEGFPIVSLKKSIYFKFAENKKDYEKVLQLRKLAYAKKIQDPSLISDSLDERSIIVMAVYKDQLIATLRLIFNDGTQVMENEKSVKLPDYFPPKNQILEVGRVCTHPDFRGSDLLTEMFRFTALTLAESDRKYIVTGSMKNLLPLYKKLGFKTTGIYYRYKELNNLEHQVLFLDVYKVGTAKTLNPIRWLYWNVVWEELYDYVVIQKKLIKFTKIDKLRIKLIKLLKPVSFLIYSYYIKKNLLKQKHK
jgi:predicted GNAT family N-acyltransferase